MNAILRPLAVILSVLVGGTIGLVVAVVYVVAMLCGAAVGCLAILMAWLMLLIRCTAGYKSAMWVANVAVHELNQAERRMKHGVAAVEAFGRGLHK